MDPALPFVCYLHPVRVYNKARLPALIVHSMLVFHLLLSEGSIQIMIP